MIDFWREQRSTRAPDSLPGEETEAQTALLVTLHSFCHIALHGYTQKFCYITPLGYTPKFLSHHHFSNHQIIVLPD
jgi:hypothetical protein